MKKHLQISSITLLVSDLNTMIDFYTKRIGFVLLKSTSTTAELAMAGSKDVSLYLKRASQIANPASVGLYHLALLLPHRSDLASFLTKIVQSGYPVDGASDHGYSEAVYLQDPEGNGLEIYVDKAKEFWDIRPDGQIIGVTERLNTASLLAEEQYDYQQLPKETRIGHLHLTTLNIATSLSFFNELLDFKVTSKIGDQAVFFGFDGYHHQFAVNRWQPYLNQTRMAGTPGLEQIQIDVSEPVWQKVQRNIEQKNKEVEHSADLLLFQDANKLNYVYRKMNFD